jgi:exopolysaccharide production protein ExoZ
MVVWHHSLVQIAGMSQFISLPDFGPSGVDLFFVISGFIMYVTTTDKALAPGAFLALRIVRVVPLYWLMTFLVILCGAISPATFRTLVVSPAAVTKSLLFIPYNSLSFPGQPWPVLVPGWTLNYEMFFYAIFALCLFVSSRWRLASLVAALGCLVVAGKIIGPSADPLVWVYTNPMLLEFVAGSAIGYLWLRQSAPASLAISCLGIVAGGCLLLLRGAHSSIGDPQMYGAALMVAGSVHPTICAVRSRVLLALGDASYSIYLTHLFTLGALRSLWPHLISQVTMRSSLTFILIGMFLSAGAGVLAYRWAEKPLTNWLRASVLARSTPVRVAETAS